MKDFALFWKSFNVDKSTVDSILKEMNSEISYLSTQRLPYAKGREMTKLLEKIHSLQKKRDELSKKYGRTTKNPYPTITPAGEETDVKRAS